MNDYSKLLDDFNTLTEQFQQNAGVNNSPVVSENICGDNRQQKKSDSNLKIGFLTTWNQPCGLATYAGFLLKEFPKGSFWVFAEDSQDADKSLDEPNTIRCWHRESGDFEKLYQVISEKGINLLHINCHSINFFELNSFEGLLNRLEKDGVRVVLAFHSIFTFNQNFARIAKKVDRVIVNLPENRLEMIAQGVPSSKVELLEHGVYVDEEISSIPVKTLRQKFDYKDEEKIVSTFGFIQPNKGIEGVIQGIVSLRQNGQNIRGIILGQANKQLQSSLEYLEALKKMVRDFKAESYISFIDTFLPQNEVLSRLRASDVVVMNYQSQYYESSGACALALGSGALIATSLSPLFASMKDAVWHISAGFPIDISLHLLLNNADLRAYILERSKEYITNHSWKNIAKHLFGIYERCLSEPLRKDINKCEYPEIVVGFAHLDCPCDVTPQQDTVDTKVEVASPKFKVLMQNRKETFTYRGGDTIVIERLRDGLRKLGVEVVVDTDGSANPADFDLVHLFNFVMPDFLRERASRAIASNKPFVITTLNEDVANFHNQSLVFANFLMEYVNRGQDKEWYKNNVPNILNIPRCNSFDNSFVVKQAAALFTNGSAESNKLQEMYGQLDNIKEIVLGIDNIEAASPELFINKYGVKDFIFCVGRLESRKNQLMLLKALEDSDLPLVLAAGNCCYQPQYAEAVRKFKRRGKTLVLDYLSDEMLASAYAAAKVHILPSWYELPGLVSLEAGARGCQLVVTDTGTTKDYLGDSAFYCKADDDLSIKNTIIAAYYAPLSPKTRGLCSSYNWDSTVLETYKAYQAVLGIKEDNMTKTSDDVVNIDTQEITTDNEDFQFLLEKGEDAARQKKYNLAHDLLEKAEKMNPSSVRALRARGAVFYAESNFSRALSFFKKALDFDTKDPRSWSGLGMCENSLGNIQLAYDHFIKALELDGEQVVAILQLVDCSYKLDKFDDLKVILKKYLDLHPDNTDIQYCYAAALFKTGDLANAKEVATRLLQNSPEHLGAQQLLSIIEETSNKESTYDNSLDNGPVGEQAKEQKSDDFDSKYISNLLDLEDLKRNHKYDEVISGCEELLRFTDITAKEKEWAQLLSAESYVLSGKNEKAAEIFNNVLSVNSNSARALNGQGALAIASDNWQLAIDRFENSLKIDKNNDVALAGLGTCAVHNSNNEEAWNYFKRALDINCENVRSILAIIDLGYRLNRLGEVEKVIQAYLELHPASIDFLYSLAGCHFAQGKYRDAEQEVEKILLFDPENKRAKELQGLIAEKMNH